MSWVQPWDDPQWLEFLKEFYHSMWNLSWNCTAEFMQNEEFKVTAISATFEKVAPPAVYLKEQFETWKRAKAQVSPPVEKAKATIGQPATQPAKPLGPPKILEGLDPAVIQDLVVTTDTTDDGQTIVLAKRKFDVDTFKAICKHLETHGLRWVSAGKDSGWKPDYGV